MKKTSLGRKDGGKIKTPSKVVKNSIKTSISIVIPAYNEEERLPPRLDEILAYFKKRNYDYEIIIVDDGSTDKTSDIVKKYIIKDKRIMLLENGLNRGKGYSVKNGMLHAKKEYVLFTDSDKSTSIDQLPKLLQFMDSYDIAIGSRAVKDADIKLRQPFYKVIFGKAGNLLIQLLATPGIKDTQCGFKLFRKNALFIFEKQTLERWGFDFEILFIAAKHGLKIKEVGVVWINDERTKVKFTNYFNTLAELLKIRWNHLKGIYRSPK